MREFVGGDGQLAMELTKMNDLVELPDSMPDRALLRIDGTRYEYLKGRDYVTVIVAGTLSQRLTLTASNKTPAKRASSVTLRGAKSWL